MQSFVKFLTAVALVLTAAGCLRTMQSTLIASLSIPYEVEEIGGGVREGHLYEIDEREDSPEWRTLMRNFEKVFPQFKKDKDYGFGDWHYGMRTLAVYIYNEGFYNRDFVRTIVNILNTVDKPSYAQFECYCGDLEAIGDFLVFNDRTEFSQSCERRNLITKLGFTPERRISRGQ